MKMKTNLIRITLLLAVLLLPGSNAHAQSSDGDILLFGQNYTLEEGDELNGNVAVFGGNITVQDDAVVDGDVALIGGNFMLDGDVSGNVAVIGGNITISGTVDGDLVVVGGQVKLTETAVIDGDIATVGGQVEKDPGAEVTGTITNNQPLVDVPDVPGVPDAPNVPDVPNPPETVYFYNPIQPIANMLGWAFLWACVAALLSLFLEQPMQRIGDYAIGQPLIAGSIGLLSLFIGGMLIFTFVPILILVAAWFLGVIALGQEVGERFTRAINQTWPTPLRTSFGTFLLVLVGGLVNLIPCVGWMFSFMLALIGIGAVVMTRFGSRSGSAPMIPATAPPPAAGPAD